MEKTKLVALTVMATAVALFYFMLVNVTFGGDYKLTKPTILNKVAE